MKRYWLMLILFCFSACAAKQVASPSPAEISQKPLTPLSAFAKLQAPFVQGSKNTLDFAYVLAGSQQFRFEILDPITLQPILALGSNGMRAWWWEKGRARSLSVRKFERQLQKRMQAQLALSELSTLLRGEPVHFKAEDLHAEFADAVQVGKTSRPRLIRFFKQQEFIFEVKIREWHVPSQLDPQVFSAYE